MGLQRRALDALAEALGSISNTHLVAYSYLIPQDHLCFFGLCEYCTHVVSAQTCAGKPIPTHKIVIFYLGNFVSASVTSQYPITLLIVANLSYHLYHTSCAHTIP